MTSLPSTSTMASTTTEEVVEGGIKIYIDYKNPTMIDDVEGILGSYFLLPVIFFGLIGNAVILLRMPLAVGISKKLRMFYIVIACADLKVLIVIYCLSVFPAFGIGYWTNGAVQWTALNVTKPIMIGVYILWDTSKAISASTLALLSIERTTAVMRPFKAQQWTFKRSARAIALVLAWSIAVPAITTTCFFQFKDVWGIALVHFTLTVLTEIAPLLIVITCVVLLPLHVMKQAEKRKHMLSNSASGSAAAANSAFASAEVRNAIALATVNAVYVLSVIVPHTVDLVFPVQMVSVDAYNKAFAIARFMSFFSSIAYAANFYIYMITLSPFRDVVFCKR